MRRKKLVQMNFRIEEGLKDFLYMESKLRHSTVTDLLRKWIKDLKEERNLTNAKRESNRW